MLIRDKDKQLLCGIFSSFDFPMEVWAYGSRVSGNAHEGSDLDLVIRSKAGEKLPLDLFLKFKEKIQHSNIPIIVELFDWQRIPENFQDNIKKQHEVLFSNISASVNEPAPGYIKSIENRGNK